MSAELLRKAAAILRERAEAATPGPWQPTRGIAPGVLGPREPEDMCGGFASILRANLPLINGQKRREANVAHAATMHPGVGVALADWLDATADLWPLGVSDRLNGHAVALARLIVGEQS